MEGVKSHLHDLVALFHSLFIGGAVWLNSTYEYANIVSPHQPQTNAALLHERHRLKVWAVPENEEENLLLRVFLLRWISYMLLSM